MAVSPNIFINYVSEFKKCFITRNNGIIKQKFKIDSSINDDYYFQIINSNNQIVSLSGRQFEIYGSFVDNKGTTHILFYSPTGDIQNDVLHFKINTFTTEYLTYIRTNKIADVTIVEKVNSDTQVVLRDQGIFYKRPNIGDVPPGSVYSAGEGLKLEGSTFVLTGTVLSGDGETIQINDNVISCIGGGGTEYTAGSGIAISQDNVISLSATIPSATSQLVNDSDYIAYVSSPDSSLEIKYFSPDGVQIKVASGFINNYALTSAIPLSTSQLTNDSNFITSNDLSNYIITGTVPGDDAGIRLRVKGNNDSVRISWLVNDMYYTTWRQVQETLIAKGYLTAVPSTYALKTDVPSAVSQLTNDSGYITTAALSDYATTGQLDTVSTAIPLSTSQLINDDGFITSSALTGISVDNQQTMLIDNTVQGSGFVLGYNKDYDIFYNKISTSDGVLNINPLSGVDNIEVGKVATFEHWIKPEGSLTGVSLGSDLNLVGELPSSYSANNTQVFTRRVIRLNSQTTIQQISYAYQFLEPPTPLTFKAVSGATEVALVKGGNPYPVTLEYSVNKGSWSSYTIGDTINLASGDIVSFRGNNDHFNIDDDNKYAFTFNNRVEGYGNVQSLLGFDKSNFDDGVFASFFYDCTNLQIAPNVFTTGTAGSNCMTKMFWGCSNLKKGPIIGDVYLSGNNAMQRMFRECTSLTAVQLKFNSWGADEYNSYAWIMDADNPTSYSSGGLIIIPQSFSYSRGGYAGMPESSGWIILNRIDGQLYYAENEDGHSQGDLFTGTDPFAE